MNETSEPDLKQTILIVDDEEDIRDSLRELFEGYLEVRVLVAASGAAALETLHNEVVDLIITDYRMPGLNGLEFLTAAKGMAPGVPRMVMTAYPDLDVATKAINEARVTNFLTKPIEPDTVIEIVAAELEKRRAALLRDRAFARSLNTLRERLGEAGAKPAEES